MIEQLVMMAMQTCQNYAEKSAEYTLTEYEVLMYEQLCRFVATYSRGHDLMLRQQLGQIERDTMRAEAEHEEWLRAQDKDKPE